MALRNLARPASSSGADKGWLRATSLMVLHSPLQYRSAVDSVIQDLHQLEPHCDEIMVIAHSQGAKLAYDALKMGGGCMVRRSAL